MPIKNYKPITPGTRGMSTLVNEEITTSTPEKSLLVKKSKTGGRNNQGRITVRHIGGGVMLVGKRINGRYKIMDMIGGGGMSHVYLAHDMILNREVAIKILRYDFSNEEELHRRFQREALAATSLAHPNIVSIYDVGEDGDLHFIVMEYIEGKTLKQYIQEFSPWFRPSELRRS